MLKLSSLRNLKNGSHISIRGNDYIVEGYVVYDHRDRSKWKEYRLKDTKTYESVWLSVSLDNDNEISVHMPMNSKYDFHKEMNRRVYTLYEDDYANVHSSSSDMDVDYGEYVEYKEYRDSSNEHIITKETWETGKEYSVGIILNQSEISETLGDKGKSFSGYEAKGIKNKNRVYAKQGQGETHNNTYGKYEQNENYNKTYLEYGQGDRNNSYGNYHSKRKKRFAFIGAIMAILFVSLGFKSCSQGNKGIEREFSKDYKFNYLTSVTSPIKSKLKSNVYKTDMSIEDTYDYIRNNYGGHICNSDISQDDSSIAMNTPDEYLMIYESDENETIIQVMPESFMEEDRDIDIDILMYRPRHHNSWGFYNSYYNTYRGGVRSNPTKFHTNKGNVRQSKGTGTVKQSKGTDVVKQSKGTDVVKQSKGTDVVKQSKGTDVVKQNKGTSVVKQNKSTSVVKQNKGTSVVKQNTGSIRQSSSGSRSFQGGGTSFGK